MNERTFPTLHVTTSFKTCTNCGKRWETLEAFIQDATIELVGYMPTFDDLANGLFLFNHSCQTTLALRVRLFEHLYDGPIYQVSQQGKAGCLGYCQNQSDFSSCQNKCSCAFVRETLQIIKQWPKSDVP
jgi:hypothetical protein